MPARIRHAVIETLLWLAAVAGALAIVLVICAHFFSISLILFRTGSMDPTIPQGSAAVVREIPAEQIQVGDVVTVDRPGQLPVTHRVTSASPGDAADQRVITMRGDANDSDDPYPYSVTEVRQVLWSAPGLAQPIHRLGDPAVMGGITVTAALLVGWAFWPRDPAAGRRTGHDDADDPPGQPDQAPHHRPRHAAGPRAGMLMLPALLLGAGIPLGDGAETSASVPSSGSAQTREEPVMEIVQGEHLRLTTLYRPESSVNLTPGETVLWEVGVTAEAPDPGTVRIGLSGDGESPLRVSVETCAEPWTGATSAEPASATAATCAPGEELLRPAGTAPGADGVEWLDEFSTEDEAWLRVLVALPEDVGREGQGLITALRVHAQADQDDLSAAPPSTTPAGEDPDEPAEVPGTVGEVSPSDGELAVTGSSVLWLLVAALGSMTIGALVLRARRRSSRGSPAPEERVAS